MVIARRWLAFSALALAACPAPETPPQTPAGAAAASGSALERQVRSGQPTLLAGVASPADKKAIMKEVSQQLGVQCDYCHDVTDFTAATPNKTIAGYMYAHFSLELQPKAGGVATCATCHHGKAKFLGDRADKERIKQEMKAEMTEPFRTRAGGAVECATCHGAKIDQPFLPR